VTKALESYTKAEVEAIESVKDAAQLAGLADGAAVFYAAQDRGEEAQRALEIALRLKRRAGTLLLPPGKGGRTPRARGEDVSVPHGTVTPYQEALEQSGITPKSAHNWQALARIPDEKMEQYFAETALWPDNYSIAAALKYAGGFYGRSDSPEWETPQWLFDLLNAEFHFELDVCAQPETAKCKKFYSPDDDGLKQTWAPRHCWMNPPYGTEIAGWLQKALEESRAGALVTCLVPARPDTNWWWDHALHGEMRFIKGRLVWQDGGTPAPFPSAVVILSPEHKRKVVWWDVQSQRVS
jgi:phage N-6-adenine-methyltransferase